MAEIVGKVGDSLDADLEILQPEEHFIIIEGERVDVKPYTFAGLLKAFKYLKTLYNSLQEGESIESNIMNALAEHGDDVIGLISLATGKPKEYFDTLDAVKGLDLSMMTYKVNESFFVQHLIPKLQELFQLDSQETPEMEEEESPVEVKPKARSKKAGSTSSKS